MTTASVGLGKEFKWSFTHTQRKYTYGSQWKYLEICQARDVKSFGELGHKGKKSDNSSGDSNDFD